VNRLATAFAREPNIAFAYLYGSFVEADAFHDVDIGVYVSRLEPAVHGVGDHLGDLRAFAAARAQLV
jgi:predicted nucleotidyltransferase